MVSISSSSSSRRRKVIFIPFSSVFVVCVNACVKTVEIIQFNFGGPSTSVVLIRLVYCRVLFTENRKKKHIDIDLGGDLLLFSGGKLLSFHDETLGRSKGISVGKKSASAPIQKEIYFCRPCDVCKQLIHFTTTKELESIIHRVPTSFCLYYPPRRRKLI